MDWDEDGEIDETIDLTDDGNPNLFVPQPEIEIERMEDGSIQLTWEDADDAFSLESSSDLNMDEWEAISDDDIEVEDGVSSITIEPADEGTNFFRLRITD